MKKFPIALITALQYSAVIILTACSKSDETLPTVNTKIIELGFKSQASFRIETQNEWIVTSDNEKYITFSPSCPDTLKRACGKGSTDVFVHFERPIIYNQSEIKAEIQVLIKSNSNPIKIPIVAKMIQLTGRLSLNDLDTIASQSDYISPNVEYVDSKPNQLIVVLNKDKLITPQSLIKSEELKPLSIFSDKNSNFLLIQSDDLEKDIAKLSKNPAVQYVEPNYTVRAASIALNDDFMARQTFLPLVGLEPVWHDFDQNHFNREVKVAVLDTGVGGNDSAIHPDLEGAAYTLQNGHAVFTPGSIDLLPCSINAGQQDCSGTGDGDGVDEKPFDVPFGFEHGTHVTGIIAAQAGQFKRPCPTCKIGNGPVTQSGVVGVAGWTPMVKTSSVRVLDGAGDGTAFTVTLGILWAAGEPITIERFENGQVTKETITNPNPADIINMSLGTDQRSETLCQAVKTATDKGILMVAAAGNSGQQMAFYPAACEGALSVGSVEYKDGNLIRSHFSNYGRWVDLLAFGNDVLSTSWQNAPAYAQLSGTSMASPQVAALAALLLASSEAKNGIEAGKLLVERSTEGVLDFPNARVINARLALQASGSTDSQPILNLVHNSELVQIIKPDANGRFSLFVRPGDFKLLIGKNPDNNGRLDNSTFTKEFFVPMQEELDLGTLDWH